MQPLEDACCGAACISSTRQRCCGGVTRTVHVGVTRGCCTLFPALASGTQAHRQITVCLSRHRPLGSRLVCGLCSFPFTRLVCVCVHVTVQTSVGLSGAACMHSAVCCCICSMSWHSMLQCAVSRLYAASMNTTRQCCKLGMAFGSSTAAFSHCCSTLPAQPERVFSALADSCHRQGR
jgi:hypothetical protein